MRNTSDIIVTSTARSMRVAAAHVAPIFMDAAATTRKAVQWIEQAKQEGLDLLVFPETFIPGFPVSCVRPE